MTKLPSGTVTFLFTDIEGSTKRWESQPQAMSAALSLHDSILSTAIADNSGYVFKTVGDAFCAAFHTPLSALQAALAAQRELSSRFLVSSSEAENQEPGAWNLELKVRMALHTGMVEARNGDYFGQPLNRVARLLSAAHGGQVLLSDPTYDLVRDSLPSGVQLLDLGEHRLKDLIRPERILQLVAPGLPSDFPPLRTLESHPNNLPLQPTPFIGREKELASLAALLRRADVRLVTLTGPGGTGKTRLALQVAAELLEDFEDGVFSVELAALTDPSLVPSTIAQALGVMESAGKPLVDSLKDYLRDKHLLLVLDNFEQVSGATSVVDALLKSAPHLRMLVTSRVNLRLYGEHAFPVPPFELPDPNHLPSLERLTQYEAVQLFIERAQAAKPDFQVTNENAPAVAETCVRLDGLPLAIELAAARVRLLPPQALLARLSSRLKMLTGGAVNLPARQQTLRNTIGWSYDLLSEGEKQLFRRMAVFQGGRTLQALEAVCNYDVSLQVDVLDGVESLLDKSLLQQREGRDGEPRFWMLETIHEYAREKLQESGEEEVLGKEHARQFMRLAEEAEPHLRGAKQQEWLDRLEEEHDNLRAALRWSEEEGSIDALEVGWRLAASISRFWDMRGHFTEARERLSALLSAAQSADVPPSKGLAGALNAAGWLAWRQGDYDAARSLLEQALRVARDVGDKARMAFSFNYLGLVAHYQGDYATARPFYEQSLALYRELGDKWGVGLALNYLGDLASQQGDYSAARSLHGESLSLRREIGDKRGMAQSLSNLGKVDFFEGDYPTARSLLEQAVPLRREIRDKWGIVATLYNLGNVVQMQRDYPTARSLYEQSLTLIRELGDKHFIAAILAGLGGVWVESGRGGQGVQAEKGARLLGASDGLYEALGGIMEADDHIPYDRAVATARSLLGGEEFERMRAEGRAMSMEEAIEYALEERSEQ